MRASNISLFIRFFAMRHTTYPNHPEQRIHRYQFSYISFSSHLQCYSLRIKADFFT